MRRLAVVLVASGLLAIAACDGDGAATTTSLLTSTTVVPPGTTAESETTTTTRSAVTSVTSDQRETIEIRVAGEVVTGGGLIEATVGERVRIEVDSDFDDEAHLHGYDISVPVRSGQTAVIEFDANIPGVFELELEDSSLELARLQVSP